MNRITVVNPHKPSQEFAFARQPILCATSLNLYGYELLYRGARSTPWSAVDFALLHYLRTSPARSYALFVNITNDTLLHRNLIDYVPTMHRRNTYFELSEEFSSPTAYRDISERVKRYTAHNLQFALDDFGNGFDGLYRYTALGRIAFVKLDREFLKAAASNPTTQRVLSLLVAEWTNSGTTTIAEGIETPADFNFARTIGVKFVQGYFIDDIYTSMAGSELSAVCEIM